MSQNVSRKNCEVNVLSIEVAENASEEETLLKRTVRKTVNTN